MTRNRLASLFRVRMMSSSSWSALEYHSRTKHNPRQYARGPGALNWDTQPKPFRFFSPEAPFLRLPLPVDEIKARPDYLSLLSSWEKKGGRTIPFENGLSKTPYAKLFLDSAEERSHTAAAKKPLAAKICSNSMSQFLYYSLSLSAMKRHKHSEWFLRVNPSSGNLHPTEMYILTSPSCELIENEDSSNSNKNQNLHLYHYEPRQHAVELRASFPSDCWDNLLRSKDDSSSTNNHFQKVKNEKSFLVILSSIIWREEWKYGERAFRYTQHDVGHAISSLVFAGRLLNWKVQVLNQVPSSLVDQIAKFNSSDDDNLIEEEREFPALVALVYLSTDEEDTCQTERDIEQLTLDEKVIQKMCSAGQWFGQPNQLSSEHHKFPINDQIAELTACPPSHPPSSLTSSSPMTSPLTFYDQSCDSEKLIELKNLIFHHQSQSISACQIIRQRRSAVDMSPEESSMSEFDFYSTLAKTLPSLVKSPWYALPWHHLTDVKVHLGIFVHRVEGLSPGMYILSRSPDPKVINHLRDVFRSSPDWSKPSPRTPDWLPLFRVQSADVVRLAATVSCLQSIAGNGCFSLGMFAFTNRSDLTQSPHLYRELFWECGMIGHVLYLEAESRGLRGTGIGCYFDDVVNDIFQVPPSYPIQSFYHFTVGHPIEDERLAVLHPYWDFVIGHQQPEVK